MMMKLIALVALVASLGAIAFARSNMENEEAASIAPAASMPPGMVIDMRQLFR